MRRFMTIASLVCATLAASGSSDPSDTPNLSHDRHTHPHNHPHETEAPSKVRFFTTRPGGLLPDLPVEDESFIFGVFGDRTGGPAEGVDILADAVRDVNLYEPDMVMTVGDLINGYNDTAEWMVEMREYRAIMDELLCPWFPTPGNHDTYWPDGAPGGHDEHYEVHFGPLWYSFMHKDSNFIVLYTDEGDPERGDKTFREPRAQRMSDEQFAFLRQALRRGARANHQFVFVHHPRWLGGGYGTDWSDRVHPLLLETGNVTAVFAGHIHRMRSDPLDGIEYITLATVGGHQQGAVPEAGWLHHYNIVNVRPETIAVVSVPVGAALDTRDVTGEVIDECTKLSELGPVVLDPMRLGIDGSCDQTVRVKIENPSSRTIEYTLASEGRDRRVFTQPDHTHGALGPGESRTLRFRVVREKSGIDHGFGTLSFVLDREYLTRSQRYTIPTARVPLGVEFTGSIPGAREDLALELGGGHAVEVPSAIASIGQGPFTVECWYRPKKFEKRMMILSKTQGSEYGISIPGGRPNFSVHLGGSYVSAKSDRALKEGEWSHIAGVYDGSSVRLYIDGELISERPVDPGLARTRNTLPLFIGADPAQGGRPMSFANGLIDEVRLSAGVVYDAPFTPRRALESRGDTVFHYTFDERTGELAVDRGPESHHTVIPDGVRRVPVLDN